MNRTAFLQTNFTRQNNNDFRNFKKDVDRFLDNQGKPLIRLDCLNPYAAMRSEFDLSVPVEADLRQAWEDFVGLKFGNNYVYTLGVRDALHQILASGVLRETASGKDRWWNERRLDLCMPGDVYPVYRKIAKKTRTKHNLYRLSMTGEFGNILNRREWHGRTLEPGLLDRFIIPEKNLLITAPAPFDGTDLTTENITDLCRWLKEDGERIVIIDRVYDYLNNNHHQLVRLIETGQAIILYSLSKTFLQQFTHGLAIIPERLKHAIKHPTGESEVAKILLTRYRDFPKQQHERFQYRWRRLGYKVPGGYLHTEQRRALELLAYDRKLAVPGELFQSDKHKDTRHSVLSCLHESVSFGDTDTVERYYVTASVNFVRGYDKYSRRYSKDGVPESTFKDKFYLLDKRHLAIGLAKAGKLLEKHPSSRLIVLKTKVKNYELHERDDDHRIQHVKRKWITVDEVLDADLNPLLLEDVYAESMRLNHTLKPWHECKPRSFSVLPIARSCQAKCAFCFSHSSVSEDQLQGNFINAMHESAAASKALGAERMVITGGGEPTMLSHSRLLQVMDTGKGFFNRITMITNGYNLGQVSEDERLRIMLDYQTHGLTCLAISRHGVHNNAKIMHLDTKSELAAETHAKYSDRFPKMHMRWICVLQKGGVQDDRTFAEYMDWAASTGVREVCFKELYVAVGSESVYHDSNYNEWCKQHQVPLSLVLDNLKFCTHRWEKLPWGAPILYVKWKGVEMKVAAYTEPSVFWERSHGVLRSWNLMADGKCYANLETKESLIGSVP